ncbi:Low-density lipoprotein receptor domain class A [Ostertagia ostertagi]
MLYLCDGISHCQSHADETNCREFPTHSNGSTPGASDNVSKEQTTKKPNVLSAPRICLPGQFQCHDNKKCVAPGGLCDGVEDCWDASDEKYCTGSFRANSPNTKVNEMAA